MIPFEILHFFRSAIYHLRAIDQAIDNLHDYIALQQRKLKEASQLLAEFPLNHRQTAVVQRALKRASSTFTIQEHKGEHRVTYATAHTDLTGLEKLGFLRKIKKKKQWIFYPADGLLARLKVPGTMKPPKIRVQPSIAVTRKKQATLLDLGASITVAT